MKERIRAWLDETHSAGFEVMRHFLARFFDSEMTTTPGAWVKVAIGVVPILLSLGVLAIEIYKARYDRLLSTDSSFYLYRQGVRADELWFIAMTMCITAMLTAIQWQSLFPSLRDCLALASLPVSARQIFLAKLGVHFILLTVFMLAINLPPALLFAGVTAGHWQENPSMLANVMAHFLATSGGCVLVFFSLLASQGILLNILPARLFSRVSVLAQALVFTAALAGLLFLSPVPAGAEWLPWNWFLGLWATIIGAQDGSSRNALLAVTLAPAIAIVSYLFSYRRYERLLLETPLNREPVTRGIKVRKVGSAMIQRWISDPREHAAFVFIWKTLARSRNHRLVWLAYSGIGLVWILKGAAELSQSDTSAGLAAFLVAFGPLTIAVVVTAGLRYLFSLPVELHANWIFQITQQEGRVFWLRAVERFVVWCGIAPVFVSTLPAAAVTLGLTRALATSALGFMLALLSFELLFLRWQKVPFTCSYLPAKRPILLTVLPYFGALLFLAPASRLFLHSSSEPPEFLAILTLQAALWWRIRKIRKNAWAESVLRFEEAPGPQVLTLGLESSLASELELSKATVGLRPESMFSGNLVESRGARAFTWWEQLREDRGHNGAPIFWQTVLADVRYAFRLIRRNLLLSTIVVMTLTLGIGMNVSVFTVFNGIVFRPRVFKRPESFVRVIPRDRAESTSRPASYTEYLAYRKDSRSLSQLTAWGGSEVTLGRSDRSITQALLVSCNFFSVDGLDRAKLGRLFLPDDCAPGRSPVTILSEEVWHDRFGSDPQLVGAVIHINNRTFTVIGITPTRTSGWVKNDGVWLPYTAQPYLERDRNLFVENDYLWLTLAGRLAPGFSRSDAQAELSIAAQRQDRLHPGHRTALTVTDGSWFHEPDMNTRDYWIMALIVGALSLVLLISCANVTTLVLSRAVLRQREIAVRLSLGAARIRILRMLLTESILLAVVAGSISVYLAYHIPETLYSFVAKRPANFPLSPDWRIFIYISTVVFVVGLLSGLAPALELLRVDLTASLKGHGNLFGTATGGLRFRGLLVSLQVALSVVLLVEAGSFVRAEVRMFRSDPGYETRRVLVVPLRFPAASTSVSSRVMFRRIAERVQELPGVRSISYSDDVPLIEHTSAAIRLPGHEQEAALPVDVDSASPGFFETLGIAIVRGRAFRDADLSASSNVAPLIVSETFARKVWPKEDPIAKRLQLADRSVEVVGVARNVNLRSYGASENPVVYKLEQPGTTRTYMLVRFEGGPRPAVDAVRTAVRDIEPDLIAVPRLLQSWIDDAASDLWTVVALIVILGIVAVVLAMTGIYGVVACAVSQMTRDLGIRVALGAQRLDIIREVLASGGKPVGYGLLVGLWFSLAVAAALSEVFKRAPFRVEAGDPLVYLGASLLLACAALLAMIGPARRAARSDPSNALRCE